MKYLIAMQYLWNKFKNYDIIEASSEEQALKNYKHRYAEDSRQWKPEVMATYDGKTVIIIKTAVEINKLKMLNPKIKIK